MKQDERTPGLPDEALRSALEGTVAILESVERDTYYGIHDEYEPRDKCTCELCKARAVLSGSPPPSTEGLRGALAEGRQAAVELASLMREGAHDKEEIKWCKVVDKIDAALSASPEKFHNVCCNKCGYVGPATSAMGQHPDCNYIGSRVAAGSPAPSTEGLREWRDIKTAPRDGTRILVCGARFEPTRIVHWIAQPHNVWSIDGFHSVQSPTHWMPLPPAPDAARTALAGLPQQMEIEMIEATLIECKKNPGEFRVEGILDDGACEVAIFAGANAVERAVAFAGTYYEQWDDPEGWGEHLNQKRVSAPSAGVTAPSEVNAK